MCACLHLHLHLSFNHEGYLGTTDDFTTSFLCFSLFSIALLDLSNSRPVHSSSVCLVSFPLSLCVARRIWPDLISRRHVHTTSVWVSLRWSGGLLVARLPAGSWHGLPHCCACVCMSDCLSVHMVYLSALSV